MTVGIIIPTYNHFEYAELAIASAARTPDAVVIVVDDASENWPGDRVIVGWLPEDIPYAIHRYRVRAGLSRSWNRGLSICRDMELEYAVCANADVVFSKDWWPPIESTLAVLDIVGPVTNAPGHSPTQDVTRFLPDYELDDDVDMIDATGRRLAELGLPPIGRSMLNGFCLAGRTESFLRARLGDRLQASGCRGELNTRYPDAVPVFRESIPMEGNEDDFFERAKVSGLRCGVCPTSFVFHYRSIARGLKNTALDKGAMRLATCEGCGRK